MNLADLPIQDLEVPPAPGSLMRAVQLWDKGYWRISRDNAELYSVQITSAGAWGRMRIWDGRGKLLFSMPSTFTGSFWLSAGAWDGIVVWLDSATNAPTVTVNFREARRARA